MSHQINKFHLLEMSEFVIGVPETWHISDSECLLPNYIDLHDLKNSIEFCQSPEKNWEKKKVVKTIGIYSKAFVLYL